MRKGRAGVRTFFWWFGMGALTTLGVLMIQGGIRDLLAHPSHTQSLDGWLSIGSTIVGGGLLAGCIAVTLSRLR